MSDEDDFYVGYLKEAPAGLAGILKKRVIVMLGLVVLVASGVTFFQGHFNPGVFEFGEPKAFQGVVRLYPYPTLMAPAEEGTGCRYFHLVAQGKFGADAQLANMHGKQVAFQATRIYRDGQEMLEIVPDTVKEAPSGDPCPENLEEELGEFTLTGEIVDSKCYLGVMSPGNLKTHKSCAIRCIAGGIPPVLLVRDEKGTSNYFVLVDRKNRAVNDHVLDMIAEPVTITGNVKKHGNLLYLVADPWTYQRLDGK